MDKVLVTGANGFIGQHLVKKLIQNGYLVHGLVMPNTSLGELALLDNKSLKIVRGNLTDYGSLLNATKDVNIVIHLAGIVNHVNVSDNFYWNVNVKGTENLLKACIENKLDIKRFVYCSSVSVYGSSSDLNNTIIDETHTGKDQKIYGKTKYESELVSHKYCDNYKIPLTIIRAGRVYGEGDYSLGLYFKLIKKRFFFNIGNCDIYIMPVYVGDLVDAFILALENPKAIRNMYIITGEDIITKREFVNIIAKSLNVNLINLVLPKWLVIPPIYLIEKLFLLFTTNTPLSREKLEFFLTSRRYDISKAKKELGYKPQVGIKEGIRRTIEWYKKRRLI